MMTPEQFEMIRKKLSDIKEKSPFYREKYKDIDLSKIKTMEDFKDLPLTDKCELRDAYPLGLQAVPEEEVVRIHSSSGTTGLPVIIPYTKQDVEDWAIMFERCYRYAGVTNMDRIHITPGYGLWTAGIGFQAGAERLGAMVVPMGPGNTDKQLKMMQDMKTTVLTATSSYALLLAEEIEKRGIRDKIHLKKALIGSERWGDKMRHRIANELGVGFKITSGPVLDKPGDLAGILTSLEKNDVLFIDEIHRLSPVVEEYLYSAMEDYRIDIMIDKGPSARSIQIDLNP